MPDVKQRVRYALAQDPGPDRLLLQPRPARRQNLRVIIVNQYILSSSLPEGITRWLV